MDASDFAFVKERKRKFAVSVVHVEGTAEDSLLEIFVNFGSLEQQLADYF